MVRRSIALALVLATSLGASACGGKDRQEDQKPGSPAAESEALYVNLNGLKYQVQVTRQLNPKDVEDADYFRNMPANETFLPRGSLWFGVFLRVENDGKKPIPSAREFTIKDTQDNEFDPIPPAGNTFAYRPELIPGGGFIPNPERLQAYAGSQGALLVFKIPFTSLDNRPLELEIKNPSDTRRLARIDLDV